MSTSTQTHLPKRKPQASKDTQQIKAAAKTQPSDLSHEEIRNIIEMIG